MAPTVLLLDDDANFRGLVKPALEARGLEVVEAPKGRAATKALTEHDFAVLIVDGLLPDTNGMKWLEKIRAQGVVTPVVFISAFFRDLGSYKRLTEELACRAVVHKPVEPERFAAQVAALAGASEPGASRARRRKRSTLEIDVTELELDDLTPAPAIEEVDSDIVFVPGVAEEQEAQLRSSYAELLPHVLDAFVRACGRARRSPNLPAPVDEARRQAHELAGTAGSFGFHEVSTAAALVERELAKLQRREDVDWASYDRAVAETRAALAALSGGPEAPAPAAAPPAARPEPAAAPPAAPRPAAPSRPAAPRPATPPPRSGDARPAAPPEAGPMAADATQLVEMPEVAEAAAAEASPRGPAPAPLPPSAVSPERSTLLGPRLLVVDDDPALVDYVATALQSTLAAFVPATTFDEVRRARDVDAAIVSLPFGSPDRCEETVATLRAVHSRLPVALLALEDGHAIRSRAVSSGADLFLAHPLDDAELRRAVARLEAMAPARLRVLLHAAPEATAALQEAGIEANAPADGDAFFQVLERDRPQVVVLGGSDAQRMTRAVRMAASGDDLAVLLANPATDARASGADGELGPAERWVEIVRAHGDRVEARRRRAPDGASGLPTRRELIGALRAKLAETRRRARAFTLAAFEVDGYDQIRAREGDAVADRIVDGLAKLLAGRFRVEDVRGRWGGPTLVAGFAETGAGSIIPAIERLQQEAGSLGFAGRKGRVQVSVSAGLAAAPSDGDELRRLMLIAEGRLRLAQQQGGGSLVWQG
ncbi:MAG TPA: response regulator [Polyangiaceae bacterium LLY-WYZ-15_(1-7)]|nr:response regulator [Polyangiaceae bacterium LLY-WYZ-15_(1-7)]HJL11859.1 response regulator [Polyangiaceae bacterium LLY-WYZ-15_(1-7)]